MENSFKCFINLVIMSPQCGDQATSKYKSFINDERKMFQVELNDHSRKDQLHEFYSDVNNTPGISSNR